MNKKEKIIKHSLSLIMVLSFVIMPAFVLAQGNGNIPINGTGSGGWSVSSVSGYGLPNGTIKGIITNILQWILGAIGIVGVIGFAISGIMYLLSFGDDDRMKTAKNAMYYSITGVIVGLVGLVAVKAVDAMLNASTTDF